MDEGGVLFRMVFGEEYDGKKVCSVCKGTPEYECSGCAKRIYCSKSCQQEDWVEGKHSIECRKQLEVGGMKPMMQDVHAWGEILQLIKGVETEYGTKFQNFGLKADFSVPGLSSLVQIQVDGNSVRASSKSDEGTSFQFAAERNKKNHWTTTKWKAGTRYGAPKGSNLETNFGFWIAVLTNKVARV
jgi:hypothetical protein